MMAFDALAFDAPSFLPADQLTPQNIGTLRLATAAYFSLPTDTPALAYYAPRILGDVSISQSAADAFAVGGRVALGISEINITDVDNFSADLARYGFSDGRAARVKTMAVADHRASDFGASLDDAVVPFAGVIRGIDRAGEFKARIGLADNTERLVTPMQASLYQGTGGQEGGADLKGKPKPVTLGQVFNVAPVFLGNVELGVGSLPTYQSHWRAIAGHDAIRIRGVAQTMTAGTPTVGQARDWPALGMFQLGSTPDGDVTADLQGDAVPFYVNTTGTILRRMLESLGPSFGAAEFDDTAWGFAEVDLPGVVGFHQGASAMSGLQAAEIILAGSGAILASGRGGRVRLCDVLLTDAPQFNVPAEWVLSLEPVALPVTLRPLPRSVAVRYARNWSPLANIAGAVAAADRQKLQSDASTVRADSATVTSRVAQQRDLTFQSLYFGEADALARAALWRDWIEKGPRMVRFVTDRYLGKIEIGQIGRVTYSAYGFDAGFTGVVVAWREELLARRVEITMVGAS